MESLFQSIVLLFLTTTVIIYGIICCIKRNKYEIKRANIEQQPRFESIKYLPENYHIQQMNGLVVNQHSNQDSLK